MEVGITIPKKSKINVVEKEYPDIYQDGDEAHGDLRYFVGKSSDETLGEGEEEWMTRDEAIACCGFVEGAIPGAETMLEGNGGWAQGMLSRTDFSGLAISKSAKREYKRESDIYWQAFRKAKSKRRRRKCAYCGKYGLASAMVGTPTGVYRSEANMAHKKCRDELASSVAGQSFAPVPGSAVLYTQWSIGRMNTKTGATYPIRLTYDRPISEAAVRALCSLYSARGDEQFKGFKYFDVWPTRQQQNDPSSATPDMKTPANPNVPLVTALKCLSARDFVEYVRDIKKAGLLGELCDMTGARWGAGISNTRQLGNLCDAIHGKQKRNEYLAAFLAGL